MKINHKENMKAALECRQPETAVPIWEVEFQAWDNLSGKHLILGTEFAGLSTKEQEAAINNNAELMISTAKELYFSAITEINAYWEIAPGKPSYYWLPDEARLKQNELLQKYCEEEKLMLIGICSANISMPLNSAKYEEFCYRLFDEPEEIDKEAEELFRKGMKITMQYACQGYDCIFSPTDIADNRGPFFNPTQMDRWFYPYLRKWTEEVRKHGMYCILHSDGNLMPLLDNLANSGLHGIQAIDQLAGMNIKEVKEKVAGKLCVCGNVATSLMVEGPKESVYESTREILLGCKAGGGLVLGNSNAVEPVTPAEYYLELVRAWKNYGMY